MTFYRAVLVFVSAISVVSVVDYCALCSTHIACNNTGKFDPTCSADASVVHLGPNEIKQFLDEHNSLRNKIANGSQPGFLNATRMATVIGIDGILIAIYFK